MEDSSSTFVPYTVISEFGNLAHPSEIVETVSLAGIETKHPTYRHSIPLALLNPSRPVLSGVQLDAVLLAGQAHSQWLDTTPKVRKGFMIGDGTGVGKGRELAAIILDNWQQGRLKSMWFSCSELLRKDAARDLADLAVPLIDGDIPLVFKMPKSYNQILAAPGVMFCTYAMLSRTTPQEKASSEDDESEDEENIQLRIGQIIDWLGGEDFQGVIVFDEAHKAKGYTDIEKGCSRVGEAVFQLQQQLPKARVVYVSATMATCVRDMEFMTRLGLWGTSSTSFENSRVFFSFVEARGIAGCEIVACEMKDRQVYLSRNLSYNGITFDLIKLKSSTEFKTAYDMSVKLWKDVILLTPDGLQSELWATCQKFFKAMCIAAKLPEAIKIIKLAVSGKQSVVIGIQSTGEAAYTEFRDSEYHTISDSFSPCRTYLETFLLNKLCMIFPSELGLTIRKEGSFALNSVGIGDVSAAGKRKLPDIHINTKHSRNRESEMGSIFESSHSETGTRLPSFPDKTDSKKEIQNVDSLNDPGSALRCETNRQIVEDTTVYTQEDVNNPATKRLILNRVCSQFKAVAPLLPLNSLDVLQAEIGYANIAELTGRKRYQPLMKIGSTYKSGPKEYFRKAGLIETAQNGFQSGVFRVAIISEAAATGISLHSSRDAKNQDPRLHIILEAPWAAINACQQIGRTHRTNQVHSPSYQILMSDIAGEARFASTLASRMKSLGALCKADRNASHSSIWSEYEYSPKIAKKAIRELLNAIIGNHSTLDLFVSQNAKVIQDEMYLDMLQLRTIRPGKKVAMLPKIIEYEKFLNRILCTSVSNQTRFLSYLDAAIDRITSEPGNSEECNEVKELGSLISCPFKETDQMKFQVGPDLTTKLLVFQKANVLQWADIAKMVEGERDPPFYSKACASGRHKVCLARTIVPQRPKFALSRPFSKKLFKKTVNYFKNKGYKRICKQQAREYWIECENFFNTGRCSYALSHNVCKDEVCYHKKPRGQFGVIVGGILTIWDNLEHVLGKPIKFVRHFADGKQLLGIYLSEDKIEAAKSTLQSLSSN